MKIPGKTILIIDDDTSLRMLSRKILETAGCIVEEAERVRDALYKIQTMLPDLIILDLNMPEHSGFIFLKARAQNVRMAGIPVIVLSGSNTQSTVEKALALGANQFLEKPLKANLLLQKIRALFYSQQHSSYHFPEKDIPTVTAEINALITGHADGLLRISSITKFDKGTHLKVKIETYQKTGGTVLNSRVENRRLDISEGLYSQVVSLVGLSQEEKEKMQEWELNL